MRTTRPSHDEGLGVNILLATSEAVPFAKTGGLADVSGALPIELARLGHQVAVILPAYRQVRYCGLPIEPLGIDFIVPIGSKMVTGHLCAAVCPAKVPVYLVEQDQYFDRDQLYGVDGKDYSDNCERFVFFAAPCWRPSGCWSCRSTCCT